MLQNCSFIICTLKKKSKRSKESNFNSFSYKYKVKNLRTYYFNRMVLTRSLDMVYNKAPGFSLCNLI